MSFEATKREWSELYTFFRLLSDGQVFAGSPQVKKREDACLPIALIQREEHDGTRKYFIENEEIHIVGEKIDKVIPRETFGDVANAILAGMKASSEDLVTSPEGAEGFLDEVSIFDLEARTDDRTDFYLAFYHVDSPLVGFNVRSRMSAMNPILDGGRTANLKFEQTGIKFANPMINNVNALETPDVVVDRMLLIERLGGVLKYADVADKVFRYNLLMIDLHFPRMIAEMLRIMQIEGITKVSELVDCIKDINPLKIKEDLIVKNGFYEYKMKQFLLALALGMRPAKIYTGEDSAVSGILLVTGSGEVLCYQKSDKKVFEDFLYLNTRLEKGSTEKDKYGFMEKENGLVYFKLNLKIGLTKR